ncbi:hypothetical protein [Deinococcus deserti]|uniref:Outer membrane protein beta-barrel domain-containing protein n=1 Tax=Deinococcus deserti (strain DSM 17065 / CIP 109153 / LMG 22923 / VCD115) TaxID=546414 RepID=C1CVH2_DEIDV|nr:hypothetical protein [Deinococcus deserti]ACO46189.1 Conserved hypothetical protein, precursor [Deinococcus deserti VCD115]
MKKLLALSAFTVIATAGAQTVSTQPFELGLTGGYAAGLSGEVFVHAPFVAGPFGVKAGVAFTRAADAINDESELAPGTGTFGSFKAAGATESGSHTVVSLDGTYSLGEIAPGLDTMIYAGGRYGMFRATEDYGSGLNTTYTSNAFGIGAGFMASYALSGNLSLVGDLGIDHFFDATINSNTNRAGGTTDSDSFAPGDPSYDAIDNRFVRPGTNFKARIGFKMMF